MPETFKPVAELSEAEPESSDSLDADDDLVLSDLLDCGLRGVSM